jgi:DNA-binding response OmpR family regulator
LSARNKILLVDDDKDLTNSLRIGLEREGFRVEAYNDPVEALESFSPGRYDMVILDIRMDGMNGFEVYRELVKKDVFVRVCFLSGMDMQRNGFDEFPVVDVGFLKKPISISDLTKYIKEDIEKGNLIVA